MGDNIAVRIEDKIRKLREIIASMETVAVAFSGGVDSTLLLKFCHEILGDRVVAVTARAAAFPNWEMSEAERFCAELGVRQIFVDIDWESIKAFSHNPPDRCYLCKKIIFEEIADALKADEVKNIVDGTNSSDCGDYRPGMKALAELGVRSPLKEAGMTKEEIRQVLKEMGLPIWNKPAFACLASRIPYGEEITLNKLRQIDIMEEALHKLGFAQVRVRHHGTVARIEVASEDRMRFIDTALMDYVDGIAKEAGFAYTALDLSGYRTGSMNEVLKETKEGGVAK